MTFLPILLLPDVLSHAAQTVASPIHYQNFKRESVHGPAPVTASGKIVVAERLAKHLCSEIGELGLVRFCSKEMASPLKYLQTEKLYAFSSSKDQ